MSLQINPQQMLCSREGSTDTEWLLGFQSTHHTGQEIQRKKGRWMDSGRRRESGLPESIQRISSNIDRRTGTRTPNRLFKLVQKRDAHGSQR
uniref:Uncharacterized protein n=1 Tax=Picea glauca TaxID=3330 RepID=A0A101LYR4_PICGL|nr:hypothetical protein ABT39_MTgene4809 [Picea glauca]